jgi:hypothetical protein
VRSGWLADELELSGRGRCALLSLPEMSLKVGDFRKPTRFRSECKKASLKIAIRGIVVEAGGSIAITLLSSEGAVLGRDCDPAGVSRGEEVVFVLLYDGPRPARCGGVGADSVVCSVFGCSDMTPTSEETALKSFLRLLPSYTPGAWDFSTGCATEKLPIQVHPPPEQVINWHTQK